MQNTDKKYTDIMKKFNEHPLTHKIIENFKDDIAQNRENDILEIILTDDPGEKEGLTNKLCEALTKKLMGDIVRAVEKDTKEHIDATKKETNQIVKETLETRDARTHGDKSKEFLTKEQMEARIEPHTKATKENLDLFRDSDVGKIARADILKAVKAAISGVVRECENAMEQKYDLGTKPMSEIDRQMKGLEKRSYC